MNLLSNLVFVLIVIFFLDTGFWMIEKWLGLEHKIYLWDIVAWFVMLCVFVYLVLIDRVTT